MTLAAASAKRKKKAWPDESASHCDTVGNQDHTRALLAWYDRHRRVLPWRALPGEKPDPCRVWLSEIMLAQTTVKAVAPYFEHSTARWSNVVARHGGNFLHSEAELVALPGIGPYSAAAIAAIAFGARTAAIDGNGERVLARLFAVEAQLPAAKPHIRRLAQSLLPARRAGDFAQALMDLGATICTPKKPTCTRC